METKNKETDANTIGANIWLALDSFSSNLLYACDFSAYAVQNTIICNTNSYFFVT